MIHRAILGSVERMIAILTENYGGKWPFWLSPRQVVVVPISPTFNAYAQNVAKRFYDAGIWAEAEVSGDLFKKKIRTAELEQWNFILIVGGEEEKSDSVNARNRDNADSKSRGETMLVQDMITKLLELKKERKIDQNL